MALETIMIEKSLKYVVVLSEYCVQKKVHNYISICFNLQELKKPKVYPEKVDVRSSLALLFEQEELDKESLRMLRKFVFKKEKSWVIESFIISLSQDVINGVSEANRINMFRIFAHCSLREDFNKEILSSDKSIMNHVNNFCHFSIEEKKSIMLFLCHTASLHRGSCALMYVSKWIDKKGNETCNAEVTAKAATESLKTYNPLLKKYGIATIFNISLRIVENKLKTSNDILMDIELLSKTLKLALSDCETNSTGLLTLRDEAIKNLSH